MVLLLLVLTGLVFGGAILEYGFARSRSDKRVSYAAPELWPAPVRTIFTLIELGVDADDTRLGERSEQVGRTMSCWSTSTMTRGRAARC